MKKRNIVAVLLALMAVLVLFVSCADKGEENPTAISTEPPEEAFSFDDATEIITEIRAEVVTDENGEAVTDKEGKTEIVTEIVTSVISEVVTFPEGEKVDVPVDSEGKPKETLLSKVMQASADSRQFYLNCSMLSSDTSIAASAVKYKMYMKDNKIALYCSAPMLGEVGMIMTEDTSALLVTAARVYIDMGSDNSMSGMADMNIWESIGASERDYVGTTTVKMGGKTYTCEEYNDSVNVNKYYFDADGNLKRIEIIASDGSSVIFKVAEHSATVDDSVFKIPDGYTPTTIDALSGMFGGLS